MKNAIIAALVSALVAVGFAGASVTPITGGSKTVRDISKLKTQVAGLKAEIECFNGPIVQVETQTGTDGSVYYVQPDNDQDANAVYLATVDSSCVG